VSLPLYKATGICYNRCMNEIWFWSKVKKNEFGCWSWTGAKDRRGYGQMRVDRKHVSAHRMSWLIHYGPIPDGMCVLHKCDTRECVRPDHLFLGTAKDNSQDMMTKGRGKGQFEKGQGRKPMTVCKRGHAKEAGKDCKVCARIRNAAYKRRQIGKRLPRVCPICDKQFHAFGKKVYCSQKCKWTASNRKRRPTTAQPDCRAQEPQDAASTLSGVSLTLRLRNRIVGAKTEVSNDKQSANIERVAVRGRSGTEEGGGDTE